MSAEPLNVGADPRTIDYLPLADLRDDPRNPKAHDDETIDASIGRFGVLDLIVRDGRTGYIISGHGRRKALAAMEARGEQPPEGVRQAGDGTWLVPVVVGWNSRSDSESAAALIALNRTTELGGWVDESLLHLLEVLDQDDGGLVGVGYDDVDIEALRALTRHDPQERDLDDLEDRYGGMTDEDGLTRVTLLLEPEVAQRLSDHIARHSSETQAIDILLS